MSPGGTLHVPGSSASTVRAESMWNSSLRVILESGGSFANFFKSLFRAASPPVEEKATGALWPMPLPYAYVMRRGPGSREDAGEHAFQKAVNLAVGALNWLYLRRPLRAPGHILLGRSLSKAQWRVVRILSGQIAPWKNKVVQACDMGRGASKMESIERTLSFLSSMQSHPESLSATTVGLTPPSPSTPLPVTGYGHRRSGSPVYRPGLQSVSGGQIVGELEGAGTAPIAKTIEVDRLHFRGQPAFDPLPYLDPVGQQIFHSPLDMADAPGTSCIDPPRVKIHASSTERQRLFKALDDAGRLGFIGASEALHGYQSGLFAILKDLTTDRLIFDSRPFNCLERPPRRWVFSSAHAMNLCDIQLPSDAVLVCSGTDLRDFYYSFQIGHQRLVRNTLAHRMSVREARRFKCFDARLANEAYVYPALRSLAMGDTCAVELAQTSHVALAVRAGLVEATTLMAMHLPIPRGPRMTGIVIDDLINLEIITREALLSAERCQSAQDVARMLEIYKKKGLIPHEKKTFFGQTVADFWGATVDGAIGSVRASLSRVIPIAAATELVLRIGVCSAGLLEILVGCWTATFLFRRRLLCLLGVVYEPLQRGLTRKSVFKLSPQLKEELILCITLAPLAATDLRAKNSEYVYCSDASDTGLGITRAPLPPSLQSEVHRHRMRKGAWVKLLSPLRKLQRIKGLLPPAEELPMGQVLPSHPLWMVLGGALQYTEVWKQRVSKPTHINILELRALVRMESEASREGFNLRVFSLCDSQVALGCWVKGRASSFSLNQELQQSLAVHLGCNVQSNAGFLPTEFNSSDGPSRGRAVDSPTLPLPSWWEELPCLDAFDSWLREYGTDPYTLSGLPPFDELYEEVSACPRRLREAAVLTRECEARASGEDARTPRSSKTASDGGRKNP